MNRAGFLTLLVLVTLALTACGKKGAPGPDLDKGQTDTLQRTYPSS